MTKTDDDRMVTAEVARLDDLSPGTMRMVSVGEHKVALITTARGVFALDNACPHQGYGLVTGALDGDTVTCQWHNWKFDVASGRCLLGEEDVACHRVDVTGGSVRVTVREPAPEEQRERLWPSLRRGLAHDYAGQVARDTIRLLDAGASPARIMAEAVTGRAPRTEDGIGHEMAMAADCLAWAELGAGDDRVLPLVQGLAGWAEETRDRPPTALPDPDPSIPLVAAIEGGDEEGAMAAVRGRLEVGDGPAELRRQFVAAASAHHLSYGHGMIYTQKAFELIDRLGWDRAGDLLPYLARRLVLSTREDTLPYMRRAMREMASVDLATLVAAPDRRTTGWHEPGLAGELANASEAPIGRAVRAVHDGAGVEGLLDALAETVSLRLLDHDLDLELDLDEPFGWLDITHGLTTVNAVRWAWRHHPGPDTARAALFATWLAFDTGRAARRHGPGSRPPGGSPDGHPVGEPVGDLDGALVGRDVARAVDLALTGDPEAVGEALARTALADRAGSFLVVAHLIKTTEAARRESAVIGSSLPLAGVARYLAAPRLERFVARTVAESLAFIRTGHPPRR